MFESTAIVVSNIARRDESFTWREVDHTLRSIARRRAALDADEAYWLREACRLQIWKELGFVSALDYCERVLGYAPRTGQERLRVTRALGGLPHIEAAFQRGELSFSVVREITRLATPETDELWCEAATGLVLHDVERLVSTHERGDKPTDPAKAIVKDHNIALTVPPQIYAMYRQVRSLVTEDAGRHLEDGEIFGTICQAYLDRRSLTGKTSEAKRQISMTVCERCGQAWQHGGGRKVPVGSDVVAAACCDALNIGSIDGNMPERAAHSVPPAVVRLVWARDNGCCQTPGCRSTVGVQFHHIDPQCEGGPHTPENGTLRCFSCHAAIHRGALEVTGTAPHQLINRWVKAPPPRIAKALSDLKPAKTVTVPVGPVGKRLDDAVVVAQARDALVNLGWKQEIARAAVEEARAHVGVPDLEALIRDALRRCPRSQRA